MAITKTDIAKILAGKYGTPPKVAPYKVADAGGLYLYVSATALLWRYDYRLNRPGEPDDGQRKTLSLGAYGTTLPGLGLIEARRQHLDACKLVQSGGDPAADRATERKTQSKVKRAARQTSRPLTMKTIWGGKARRLKGMDPTARAELAEDTGDPCESGTVGYAADGWNALMKKRADLGKRSPKTRARDVRLVRYIKNSFGQVRLEDAKVSHLTKLLDVFEGDDKYTTRQRLQSTATHIMGFARGKGWIEVNPFLGISFGSAYTAPLNIPRPAIIEIMPFGKLLREIAAYNGRQGNLVGLALTLIRLIFVRPGNIVGAEWREFDLDDDMLWTIPFKKLKQRAFREGINELRGKPHYVPLSRQAVELLRELKTLTGNSDYLFPNADNETGHITTEALEAALNDLGYKDVHCPHGFRSSASTIIGAEKITVEGHELDRFPQQVIDFQLEHVDGSTAAIYNRNQRLPERVKMMQFWADHCDGIVAGRVREKKLRIVA